MFWHGSPILPQAARSQRRSPHVTGPSCLAGSEGTEAAAFIRPPNLRQPQKIRKKAEGFFPGTPEPAWHTPWRGCPPKAGNRKCGRTSKLFENELEISPIFGSPRTPLPRGLNRNLLRIRTLANSFYFILTFGNSFFSWALRHSHASPYGMGMSAVKPVLKQGGRSLKSFCYGLRAFLCDVLSRETLLEGIATLKFLFPIRRGWERPPPSGLPLLSGKTLWLWWSEEGGGDDSALDI